MAEVVKPKEKLVRSLSGKSTLSDR